MGCFYGRSDDFSLSIINIRRPSLHSIRLLQRTDMPAKERKKDKTYYHKNKNTHTHIGLNPKREQGPERNSTGPFEKKSSNPLIQVSK